MRLLTFTEFPNALVRILNIGNQNASTLRNLKNRKSPRRKNASLLYSKLQTIMFYIQISNGLLQGAHRKQMGEAVWEFMWCIDKITKVDEDGTGWVLGGKPIKLKDLTDSMQVHATTVSRNLNKLQKFGYLGLVRTPYGIRIKVNKAKKIFKKKSGNAVENPVNGQKRFSTNATRFSRNAKSNIRQLRQRTEYKYSITPDTKNLKKLQELKKPLMQKVF